MACERVHGSLCNVLDVDLLLVSVHATSAWSARGVGCHYSTETWFGSSIQCISRNMVSDEGTKKCGSWCGADFLGDRPLTSRTCFQ